MHPGKGELVCCGQTMELFTENTVDAAKEKHVPVIERDGDMIKVKVGSVAHPMEEKHYIEWIELVDGDTSYKKFLEPGEEPQAEFCVKNKDIYAREYCNVHGLWKG